MNKSANVCDCGNSDKLPGYRVCADCKEARELYPDLFADDAPDESNGVEDVPATGTRESGVFFASRAISENADGEE